MPCVDIYWHRYEWHTHTHTSTFSQCSICINSLAFSHTLSLSFSNPIVHAFTYCFQILLNIQSFYNWLLKSDLRTWAWYVSIIFIMHTWLLLFRKISFPFSHPVCLFLSKKLIGQYKEIFSFWYLCEFLRYFLIEITNKYNASRIFNSNFSYRLAQHTN